MARIRTIKPDFCSSADTGRLSRDARLFFLQLLPHVDDEGRTQWLPKRLAGMLYPRDDDVGGVDIARWVAECEEVASDDVDPRRRLGMVRRYEVDGDEYLAVVNFLSHQKVSAPTASRNPAPPWETAGAGASAGAPGNPRDSQGQDLGSGSGSGSGSRNRDGERGRGAGAERPDVSPPTATAEPPELPASPPILSLVSAQSVPPPEPPSSFEKCWAAYPRKADKPRAQKAWKQHVVAAAVADEVVSAGLARWKVHWEADGTAERFVPHLGTWLAGKRWEDTPFSPGQGYDAEWERTLAGYRSWQAAET